MDFFKFNSPDVFLGGQAINGWDSVSWVERYQDPGEFEFVSRLSSGLREFLPIGTLVSHIGTLEVMVVENHQIGEDSDIDPVLTITGRTLESYLDHRVVGQNWDWTVPPADLNASVYNMTAAYTWIQAKKLINDHIATGTVIMANDAIPSVLGEHSMSGVGTSEARTIQRGSVLLRMLEVLKVDNLGIKVSRRHNFALPNPGSTTLLIIHDGDDKRNSVIFSTKNGDIDSADYLWSDKKLKTSALVVGKFVETMVHGSESGRNRRVMLVDGNDIDGSLAEIPTGASLTSIRATMTVRGNQALKAQKQVALSRIDISTTPTYQFRKDYNIGDIVSVDSSYGPVASMRVIEYAELVDENGESAQPTLELLS